MKNKVFDIIPPAEETKRGILEYSVKPKKQRRTLLVFFLLLICGLIFYCLSLEPKTEIEITHETEPLNFTVALKVSGSMEQTEPSYWLEQKTIPGDLLIVENSLSQEFSSTGTFLKEEKAGGIIRVYNNYSQAEQPLLATTRFMSDTGKLFRTPERVVVPGMYYEKSKLVPGWVDIAVKAAEPGSEYNIGPATFSIPGFAGTAKYTAFYAKSFSAMTGGFRAEVSQVTKEDLEKAKKFLTEKVFEQGREELKNNFGSDFELIEKMINQEVSEFLPLAEAAQEIKTFTAQLKAKTETLGFRKSDLKNFIEAYVDSKMPEGKKNLKESLEYNYSFLRGKDKEIELELKVKVLSYFALDQEWLKKRIQGQKVLEIPKLLREEPGVKEIEIKNWPFWLKTASYEPEEIKIIDKF